MAKRTLRPIRIEGQVAYVPLTKGYEAVIDAADVHRVEGKNWSALVGPWGVYAIQNSPSDTNGKRRTIRLHRVILNAPDELEVDHIDGDGLNNRRANLRLSTAAENSRNRRRRADNTSGLKGVSWNGRRQQWQAYIGHEGRQLHLGYHGTPEAAHAAYVEASKRLHGEFGRVS